MSYVLTSLSGNLISAASAGYAPTIGADVSAIASAYVESGVSSKQDTLTFGYDDDKISAINGSALAGGGGATGDFVEKSSMEVGIGSDNTASLSSFAQGTSNSASVLSFAQGCYNRANPQSFAQGESNSAINTGCAQGSYNSARTKSFAQGIYNKVNSTSFAQGATNSALSWSFAQGESNSASGSSFAQGLYNSAKACSFAQGNFNSALNTAIVFGRYNLHGNGDTSTGDSAAFAIGDGTASTARHDLMLVTKDGEITMYSSTADTTGTGIMSSIRALSANAGGVDSATVSAIASSYAESAVSSKADESALSGYYTTANESGFLTGLPKYISVLNISASGHVRATATGQDLYGNFDYAGMYFRSGSQRPYNIGIDNTGTNFYIATAKNGFERIYASSIQSWNGKLDGSASSSFYTTSNESGFIDSAYVDSAVSGKADSSAMSSYVPYSSLEYNTASAISGINGSALAAGSTYSAGEGIDITDDVISVETPVDIVAGPGIVIDNPDGNTLRVSVGQSTPLVQVCSTRMNASTNADHYSVSATSIPSGYSFLSWTNMCTNGFSQIFYPTAPSSTICTWWRGGKINDANSTSTIDFFYLVIADAINGGN